MRKLRDGQASFVDAAMPELALRGELARVDSLLDDERFLEPFARRLTSRIGRPTMPMERYLRLMYLKHRYGLGYETVVSEVADSISWRRFCRIPLDGKVPHSTTLIKLTQRFGPDTLDELNREVLKSAVERKVLRSHRLRVDTTVTEADVRYPTDSGLTAGAIKRVARAVAKVKAVGLAARTRFRNRGRGATKLDQQANSRTGVQAGDRRARADKKTTQIHRLAETTLVEGGRVLRNAQRALGQASKAGAEEVRRLSDELDLLGRVVEQTGQRLAGVKSIPDRLVSLVDADARPIRRGKLRQPVEFGYKVSVADTPEGFVASHQVYVGNPLDSQTLSPAIEGAQDIGMDIWSVYTDRGYGDAVGDEALAQHGIKDSVIPRKGRPDPRERTRSWRRRYRFRAGSEGRISALKRRFGLARTRLRGHSGAQIWVGMGILAHNLCRMASLV